MGNLPVNPSASASAVDQPLVRTTILAQTYYVSESDILLLYERFQQLNPDCNGFVARNVFETECCDPFCRQVWDRIDVVESNPDVIDFESFVKTAVWWQQTAARVKLKLLFSWMVDNGGISASILAKILRSVLQDYDEVELNLISIQMVDMMSSRSDITVVNEEDFLSWFEAVSQSRLRESLYFNIRAEDI